MILSEQTFVDTARGRFHMRTTPGDGFPVVMLHGWPESSYCWTQVAEHLAGPFRLIAPDLRGLGDSVRTAEPEAYGKQALAQDVLALLDEIGVDQFHLVGHDWGGAVAQEVALAAPQRVQRLCLMNIVIINNLRGTREALEKAGRKGNFHAWYQHFQQAPKLAEAMIPGNEEAWLSYFLRNWSGEPFPADALEEYVRYYRIPGTPTAGANYYRAMREDSKRWATLADHKHPMPALYIYGNKDPVIIPEYLNHADDGFENLQIREIEAGHFVQEEQPETVARYLSEFLNEDKPLLSPEPA